MENEKLFWLYVVLHLMAPIFVVYFTYHFYQKIDEINQLRRKVEIDELRRKVKND